MANKQDIFLSLIFIINIFPFTFLNLDEQQIKIWFVMFASFYYINIPMVDYRWNITKCEIGKKCVVAWY